MADIIKKYKLDQDTWTYKGFHGVLSTFYPVGQTGFPLWELFGEGNNITLYFVQNNYVHWYWNDGDLTRVREKFLNSIKADASFLEKMKENWLDSLNEYDLVLESINKTNLTELSNEELANLYDKFYNSYLKEFSYFMAIGDAVSMHSDRYLVPEFEKVLKDDFNEVFPQLITTSHHSFLDEEFEDRKKLIEVKKEKGTIPQDLLAQHANKYFYIKNNYAQGDYLTASDFEKMINEDISRVENIKSEEEKVDKEMLTSKYGLTPWHKTLIYIMDEFFGIQDTRKKYVLISNYYIFEFLREAVKRTNYTLEELQYSVYPEFRNVLANKIDHKVFQDRKNGCVCINTKDGFEIITGQEFIDTLAYFQKPQEEITEFKGLIAAKGKVTGRVKIILKAHDMINMDEGDILVSSMTRPEMLPAMKQAKAIITDEGGITCHAAIVSREMGIPCIIGTKVATKVLHDGDIVEVDANLGIVRII